MDEIRFLCATGALGSGKVLAGPLQQAMELKPHFVAVDAGTTDSGPYTLGSGESNYPRESVKRDLEIILPAAKRAGIPLLIGSCGIAGTDAAVDTVVDIAHEIAAEHQFRVETAIIYSEQSPAYLKELYRESRIRPLDPSPPIDEALIGRTEHVVGMMGVEPLQRALEGGAELVIAGRCSDSALFAAMPIMCGFPEGLAWHAGKVLECSTQVCVTGGRGIVFATMTKDDFVMRPFGEDLRCTPQSVAAHSFYENGDPYIHWESSGALDITHAVYEAVDDISVRVSGSGFIHSKDYTVKLEGAEKIGYQSVLIGGIRDPFFIRQLDSWLASVRKKITTSVSEILNLSPDEYTLNFHVYGRNGVMGALEPEERLPHEVGIVTEATAKTQALAKKIALIARQPLLHHPIEEWSGSITSMAFLHNPYALDRGAVYRFCYNHVALPRTQEEMFRTSFKQLGTEMAA